MRVAILCLSCVITSVVSADTRSPGKPSAPVRIEHRLLAEPVKGQPLAVEVLITPLGRAETWHVEFGGAPALGLRGGAQRTVLAKPRSGAVQSLRVDLLPQADGVYDLDVRVTAGSGDARRVRSHSIAIPVGAGARRSLARNGTLVEGGVRPVVVLPAETTRR